MIQAQFREVGESRVTTGHETCLWDRVYAQNPTELEITSEIELGGRHCYPSK
jgi:hypothetical protein